MMKRRQPRRLTLFSDEPFFASHLVHRLEYILRLCDESAYFVVPGLRLAQDATAWPNFIVLFLTIRRPFIPGCSGQVQTQPAAGLRTDAPTSEGHPSPSPLLLPRNSYKYFACPPFFAQIIYPHTTPSRLSKPPSHFGAVNLY